MEADCGTVGTHEVLGWGAMAGLFLLFCCAKGNDRKQEYQLGWESEDSFHNCSLLVAIDVAGAGM